MSLQSRGVVTSSEVPTSADDTGDASEDLDHDVL